MSTNSHSHRNSNLIRTLVIGLVVLLFGIAINYSLKRVKNPVLEQVAKAESEASSALQKPVDRIPLSSSEQIANLDANETSQSGENQLATHVKSQLVSGIDFTISNYRRVANHFYVDVCYDLPGPGIWDINGATLLYGPIRTSNFEFREISIQPATDVGQTGLRCANLDFPQLTTSENSKTFTLIIEWIGLTEPAEGRECEEYLVRGQEALAQQGIAIQCNSGPGYFNMAVSSKPDNMTQDQADALVSQLIFGAIKGPWTFNGTLDN